MFTFVRCALLQQTLFKNIVCEECDPTRALIILTRAAPKNADEDDGEGSEGLVEEELADKPGTTNGAQFDILQSILLPFLLRCGF